MRIPEVWHFFPRPPLVLFIRRRRVCCHLVHTQQRKDGTPRRPEHLSTHSHLARREQQWFSNSIARIFCSRRPYHLSRRLSFSRVDFSSCLLFGHKSLDRLVRHHLLRLLRSAHLATHRVHCDIVTLPLPRVLHHRPLEHLQCQSLQLPPPLKRCRLPHCPRLRHHRNHRHLPLLPRVARSLQQ